MSAASGISVNDDLSREISKAKKAANVCFQKIIIRDEKLLVSDSVGKLNANIEKCQEFMTKDEPCFILYFKGPKELMLLTYMPDSASSKNKMTYSSSKGSLTSFLQRDSSFRLDFFSGTSRGEFTISNIHGNIKSSKLGGINSKPDTSAMSSVERALMELSPASLSKNEISKSAGYGLLAHISGKAPPQQLKSLNPLEAPKNNGLSVKVQILNKDRDKIYANDNKTKCVLHDCFFKRYTRGYCERHAKIYNDTPVPGIEGGSGTTTTTTTSNANISATINKFNGNNKNNIHQDENTDSEGSGGKQHKTSGGSYHQSCAVDGCGEDRIPRKAYCIRHINETQQYSDTASEYSDSNFD